MSNGILFVKINFSFSTSIWTARTTDFLLLNKPVVTFNNAAPQSYIQNITNEKDLEGAIDYVLSKPDKLMKEIGLFGKRTHPYIDGSSSLRVLTAVDEAIKQLPSMKPKPKNWIRNLKLRKRFGYWKF